MHIDPHHDIPAQKAVYRHIWEMDQTDAALNKLLDALAKAKNAGEPKPSNVEVSDEMAAWIKRAANSAAHGGAITFDPISNELRVLGVLVKIVSAQRPNLLLIGGHAHGQTFCIPPDGSSFSVPGTMKYGEAPPPSRDVRYDIRRYQFEGRLYRVGVSDPSAQQTSQIERLIVEKGIAPSP